MISYLDVNCKNVSGISVGLARVSRRGFFSLSAALIVPVSRSMHSFGSTANQPQCVLVLSVTIFAN